VARAAPEGQRSTIQDRTKAKTRQDKSGDPPAPTSAVLARLGQDPRAISKTRSSLSLGQTPRSGPGSDTGPSSLLAAPPYHPRFTLLSSALNAFRPSGSVE
jgi:hypothetical protein